MHSHINNTWIVFPRADAKFRCPPVVGPFPLLDRDMVAGLLTPGERTLLLVIELAKLKVQNDAPPNLVARQELNRVCSPRQTGY